MMSHTSRFSIVLGAVLALGAVTAAPAAAQVGVQSASVPSTIPNPMNGFRVDFRLSGSQFGSANVQINFSLSTTANGGSGRIHLTSRQVQLQGSGFGPFVAPSGTLTQNIDPTTNANVRAVLQSIANECAPLDLFLLVDVNGGFITGGAAPTRMGSVKRPDFVFTGGTINPAVISPGGATRISFDLFTRCPASSSSRVGIFLTDAAFNPLSFIGAVSIAPGAGTSTLPPTTIVFSPTIPPGEYNLLLIADVDGVLAESDENNNAGAFALTVVPAALAAGASTPAASARLEPGVVLDHDQTASVEELALEPPALQLDLHATRP